MKKRSFEVLVLLIAGFMPARLFAQVELPDPHSPGAGLVTGYCTECHGVPDPASHPAAEWPAVVERMQNWRITKGFGPIPDKDLAPLVAYLQKHGRR